MMRWWWFGPAVTHQELEREIRAMKAAGIGGFEVQATYPLALDDPATGLRMLPFLSDEFLDALRFTAEKARENGMRLDLTLGSGWPYGGPQVLVKDAASRLRVSRRKVESGGRRIPLPDVSEGEAILAVFTVSPVREVTDFHDGAGWLPDGAAGPAEVDFFLSSRTGQMVKRAAVGSEGFVLNHYDEGATGRYLTNVADRLLRGLGPRPPTAVFCDSLESYGSDWSPDFLVEFRRRRGYDLKPHLPALAHESSGESPDIRYDWGRTLSELVDERFLKPVQAWAREKGTQFRVQGYGSPPATLSSYRYVDLPEGEGAQWKILKPSRWASSASHLLGRQVTSSETWTWLHSPSFRATPLDIKAEADLHFLQGINQLIGHGWPYSPENAEYPGWRFYAAGALNDRNPWWIVMPDVSKYLQRVSHLTRQGEPANDVAFYLPNADVFAHFELGQVEMIRAMQARLGPAMVSHVLGNGYNLDFVDDGLLDKLGGRYKILLLPNVERIPVASLRRIEAYSGQGVTVVAVGRLPERAPGFLATKAEQQEVKEIVGRLFSGPGARGLFVPRESELGVALKGRVPPDVAVAGGTADIGFVHRRLDDGDIYFVVNTTNVPRSFEATFRVQETNYEVWDAFTGDVETGGRGSTMHMDLDAYASRVIVFTKRSSRDSKRPPSAPSEEVFDLSKGWDVSIGSHSRRMEELQTWTTSEDTRYFSGVVTYSRPFTVPGSYVEKGGRLRLDLGKTTPLPEEPARNGMQTWIETPVREAAVVYVNGQRAGSVWCPPYSLDITRLVKAGANELRIEVANTAMNQMAGRELPHYRLLNLRYGERFQNQDVEQIRPLPSGLLGPVRLIAVP